jgi:hypothetical protein
LCGRACRTTTCPARVPDEEHRDERGQRRREESGLIKSRRGTYNKPGHEPAKDEAIDGQHPAAVRALDDPLWDRDNVLALARAVRVAVELEVLADGLVRQRLVGLCELDKLVVDVLARLVRSEPDLVRVTGRAQEGPVRTEGCQPHPPKGGARGAGTDNLSESFLYARLISLSVSDCMAKARMSSVSSRCGA